MTLRDAILNIVPVDSWRTADQVMRGVWAFDWPEQDPRPREITDELDRLAKERTLIHSLDHSCSVYRQRTVRELGELRAEASGMQGRLI